MKRTVLTLLLVVFSFSYIGAQVFETVPGIPTIGQAITIYFNTNQLTPSDDLYMYEGALYAHTGVTIDGAKWQNVIESWGNNTTQPQLQYLGSYRYKLEITPDIENFYLDISGNPIREAEVVSEICLVIRNATSTLQTRPDNFIDVFGAGLEVNITSPLVRSLV